MEDGKKKEIRARITLKLVEREARVKRLANSILSMKLTRDNLPLLECHALELRSLAYQIRTLRVAQLAVEVSG